MTLRALISCASPLPSPMTVREHLAAINCDNLGGGGDRLVPYDDIVLDIQIDRMSVDIQKDTLSIEVQSKEIDVELGTKTLSIDMENKNKEVDNGCS